MATDKDIKAACEKLQAEFNDPARRERLTAALTARPLRDAAVLFRAWLVGYGVSTTEVESIQADGVIVTSLFLTEGDAAGKLTARKIAKQAARLGVRAEPADKGVVFS